MLSSITVLAAYSFLWRWIITPLWPLRVLYSCLSGGRIFLHGITIFAKPGFGENSVSLNSHRGTQRSNKKNTPLVKNIPLAAREKLSSDRSFFRKSETIFLGVWESLPAADKLLIRLWKGPIINFHFMQTSSVYRCAECRCERSEGRFFSSPVLAHLFTRSSTSVQMFQLNR